MTCTHDNQKRYCTVHEKLEDHKMLVSYYKCTSALCMREPVDLRLFQYKIQKCFKSDKYFVYQYNKHLDKFIEKPVKQFVYGFHSFYQDEITRILNENNVEPLTILKILIKNQSDPQKKYDKSIPLPSLSQIQGFKRRYMEKNKW